MSVSPAWEVQEAEGATAWFHVRLAFTDGARVDALAVVCAGCVSIEDVRAQPALSFADLTVLADWIETPVFEVCGTGSHEEEPHYEEPREEELHDDGFEVRAPYEELVPYPGEEFDPVDAPGPARRARAAWPRGIEGRWLVAQEYRAAQEDGEDPVLAVMCATGHSRRRSLRLIAQARDAGFLAPRRARR